MLKIDDEIIFSNNQLFEINLFMESENPSSLIKKTQLEKPSSSLHALKNLLYFDLKSWEKPLCPGGYETTHLCLNPMCKYSAQQNQQSQHQTNNSFICSNQNCEVCCHPDDYQLQQKLEEPQKQKNHSKCFKSKYLGILSCIQKKMQDCSPIKNSINKIFDDFIEFLSDLRQKYLDDVINCGLSQYQHKFLTCSQSKNYGQINPKLTLQVVKALPYQLNLDMIEVKQNLQKQWKIQEKKAKDSFVSIGQKISKQQFKFLSNKLRIDSEILFTGKEKLDLINLFQDQGNRKIRELVLLFRASSNQFLTQKFHEKCDNIGETLTLIETEHGKKIGGFTSLKWDKNRHGKYEKDLLGQSFIFSLTNNQKFIITNAQKTIYNNSSYGPTFGQNHDIYVSDKSNQNINSCTNIGISYSHPNYKPNDQTSWTKFNGAAKGKNFLIKQWEVFKIIWM